MTVVLQGVLDSFLGVVNALQIIFVLPGIRINFPANVNYFYSVMNPFVTFDVLPPEWSTKLVFNFNEGPDEPFNEQLETIGFETSNLILNLGSLSVALAIMTV